MSVPREGLRVKLHGGLGQRPAPVMAVGLPVRTGSGAPAKRSAHGSIGLTIGWGVLLVAHLVRVPALPEAIPQFVDITGSSNIAFRHMNGAERNKRYLFELKGGRPVSSISTRMAGWTFSWFRGLPWRGFARETTPTAPSIETRETAPSRT